MANANTVRIVQSANDVNSYSAKVRSCFELMSGDTLTSGIVRFKVHPPNKPTQKNQVKKLGPENRLVGQKIW